VVITINGKVLANTTWIIGGKIFQMVLSLIISMMIARYLGPSNFGLINYVVSFVALFTSVSALGLDGIIVNELVKGEKASNDIIGTSIVIRFISGLLSIICVLALVYLFNRNNKLLLIIALLQSLSLPLKAFESINFWFQYQLKSKYIVIAQIVGYIITSTYKIFLLLTEKGVVWFSASISLEVLFVSLIMINSYSSKNGLRFKFSPQLVKSMLSRSYHFIIAGIMATVYAQIDKVMLGNMVGISSVGVYTAAVTVSVTWSFIPIAVIESLRPVIMELRNKNFSSYEVKLKQLLSIILWISIFFSLGIAVFGKWIILILFGNQYFGAHKVLYFYSAGMVFSYIGNVRSLWLICEEKYKYVQFFSIAGAITNIILNLIMINLWGIYGAAIATSITQIALNMIIPLMFFETKAYPKYLVQAFNLKMLFKSEEVKRIVLRVFLRKEN